MAPNLRSSSRATPHNSRPSTPIASHSASEFFDSSRPRKQRRTGRHSRIGVEILDTSRENTAEPQPLGQLSSHKTNVDQKLYSRHLDAEMSVNGKLSIDQLIANSNWDEPTLRESQPSYKDYTWSNAWYGQNAALSSMRPLGHLPSAADKRKAGIKVPKQIKEAKEHRKVAKKDASQENLISESNTPVATSDPASLPTFTSTEYDVEKLRSVVQVALRVAEEAGNRAVSQGLRRLWDQGSTDPFALSILDSVMRKNPDSDQKAVFKTVMRDAYKRSNPADSAVAPEPVSRSLSTTSVSSLSSTKSTGPKPMGTPTTGTAPLTRGRKRGRDSELLLVSSSMVDEAAPQSVHVGEVLDHEEQEDLASIAKRTRRDNFPIVAREKSSMDSSFDESEPEVPDENTSSERAAARDGSQENRDYCHQCQTSGSLLCCDGSAVGSCKPPEGQWFCPTCEVRLSFKSLVKNLGQSEQEFQLPHSIRHYYQGVQSGKGGVYQQVATNLRSGPHGRGRREGRAEQEYLTRQFDAKGKLIVCIACGLTSNGTRPMIQCDYCPCWWHIDCTDPPLPGPPKQLHPSDKTYHNWMCPNHIDHELYVVHTENGSYAGKSRIRRPRNPRVIDIDILPEDSEVEELQETESQGIVYRVSEQGVKLNFIERVKRENLDFDICVAGAERYRKYASKKLDELVERAAEFYQSAAPQILSNTEAEASILGSRSPADREAIANLVSFATQDRDIPKIPSDRVTPLIDALLASSEEGAPHAPTELESLQALQELISRRIGTLQK
ncbi:putative PHD finger domain protein [Talaromyces proteolyticus]|uniref:PHD finger domain protein n=1 Tax=Talaromyces proteolyticus TaxID=1131652 RepID=A0AAD4Q060_9EURO|nr:putative PHD finger domain protein [Talaromyces proteolyticus]KAH8696696.1 putative PHD finger domain protein [Talaromyces proteolyticus]